ncbi:pectinesterase/pectinesterase inhibitor 12 [Pyrus ussuriensis x Pyrus communis]|uniref:Pectinesterase/pectinesterase inhibitor 12 n=1 Tax=Pyrus ussuriensis x Pyrus communis TaxID=2448454 RepID=A0A5N5GRQ4_9ROSA|nr:pectinesterase/pectinesterase inhibitor 12 [Pyrus ussuriensis x Pyrus communis]
MASCTAKLLELLCIILFLHISSSSSSSSSSNETTFNPHLSSIRSFCKSTPYPDICFDSLKLRVSINITPNILSYLLQSLNVAISEAGKLTDLFYKAEQYSKIVEKQKVPVQDCKELHQITLSSLQRSVSRVQVQNAKKLNDARAYLSAALTNKDTCMEGLASASGPMKWLSRRDCRILESSGNEYDPGEVLTVAADGSGNFTTISDAIIFSPNNSYDRTIIYVKEGIYEENVEIPSYKTNLVLFGDGSDITFITGKRSYYDGWTPFRSATVAVSGEGFLARDITIKNTAGPEKHQAVTLRINAGLAAIYKCAIDGYQRHIIRALCQTILRRTNWSGDLGLDTLYYREYKNYGPGAGTDNRVNWTRHHVMDYYDASNFSVQEFIAGDEWLQSTLFPYDEGT